MSKWRVGRMRPLSQLSFSLWEYQIPMQAISAKLARPGNTGEVVEGPGGARSNLAEILVRSNTESKAHGYQAGVGMGNYYSKDQSDC